MNKELEQHGYNRVRMRKARQQHESDQSEASSFRYGSRRWRDPDDVDDLRHLQLVWPDVNKEAKVPCPLEVALECLRDAVAESRNRKAAGERRKGRPDTSSMHGTGQHDVRQGDQESESSEVEAGSSSCQTADGSVQREGQSKGGETAGETDPGPSLTIDTDGPLSERRRVVELAPVDDVAQLLMEHSEPAVDLSPQGVMSFLAEEEGNEP